jgi:hypothetical protein
MTGRRRVADTLRFHLRYWPARARFRTRAAFHTWKYARAAWTAPPPPPPEYTLTGDAVAGALLAAGLADQPGEVQLPREPWYTPGSWSAWADLPRRWQSDGDLTGADYHDRRARFAAHLGVTERRVSLYNYPAHPTRLIVTVHNRPVVDLLRDEAYADD